MKTIRRFIYREVLQAVMLVTVGFLAPVSYTHLTLPTILLV